MRDARGREARMPLAAGLALLALATGPAGAHGPSVTLSQDVPPYHVIFYVAQYVVEGEYQRVAWNVSAMATQQPVGLDDPHARIAFFDQQGSKVQEDVRPLEQPLPGLLTLDITMGPVGRANFTILLPNGSEAGFEQEVRPIVDPSKATAGAPTMLAIATAAAAALAGPRKP